MIVAGFGFRKTASADSLHSALAAVGAPAGLAALAAPADKCAAPAFAAFARSLCLPVIAVSARDLAAAETLTRSLRVHAERGTGSVAEAAALSAAGQGGRLTGPRMVSTDHMATCAIAQGFDP